MLSEKNTLCNCLVAFSSIVIDTFVRVGSSVPAWDFLQLFTIYDNLYENSMEYMDADTFYEIPFFLPFAVLALRENNTTILSCKSHP